MKFLNCFILLFLSSYYLFGFEKDNNALVIDLTSRSINDNAQIKLDSGWEFYWNELIAPNSFESYKPTAIVSLNNWTEFNIPNKEKLPSFGYATYRLRFKISKEKPITALYIPKIFSSSKIWVNNEFIAENGHVSKVQSNTIHRKYSHIIPLKYDKTEFEVVIQVANFYHKKAGINQTILLSTSKYFYDLKFKQTMSNMLFIGCLSFIGFFLLIFYLLYWNKDKAVLYFSILCISLIYITLSDRYAPLTYLFKSINWALLLRIEFIFLYLVGTSASLFFNTIFSNEIHKLFSKIAFIIWGLFSILTIVLPSPYFTELLLPYFGIMLCNIVYGLTLIIKSFVSNRRESVLLMISIFLGGIIFSIHIFFSIKKNNIALIYVNFGYIFVYLIISMLLMKRFSISFKELEISNDLALEQKKEISLQSDELKNINLKLEENLSILENYNTELDDFNHIVSHDLKSPLISIYSLVSFIEEDLKTTLNKDTKQHLALLKNVVFKMEALINGLLEYSKVAKGDKQKTAFKLDALIHKVIGIVDSQNKNTITVLSKKNDVYANQIELEHVFQNLISNAIKHNDKKRAIIDISVTKSEDEYLFSVSDNGPGIAPEYHTKIFKIFNQLKVNEDVESTGIGLAIVKKIITENKGIITVDSEIGIGTKISFTWKI